MGCALTFLITFWACSHKCQWNVNEIQILASSIDSKNIFNYVPILISAQLHVIHQQQARVPQHQCHRVGTAQVKGAQCKEHISQDHRTPWAHRMGKRTRQTYIGGVRNACIHTYIHTYIHFNDSYIHTHRHTLIHTYIQTYIHAYVHTCIHVYMYLSKSPPCLVILYHIMLYPLAFQWAIRYLLLKGQFNLFASSQTAHD